MTDTHDLVSLLSQESPKVCLLIERWLTQALASNQQGVVSVEVQNSGQSWRFRRPQASQS
jgi:hypothetical protein